MNTFLVNRTRIGARIYLPGTRLDPGIHPVEEITRAGGRLYSDGAMAIGLGLYLFARSQRWAEIGRLLFFAGLLVALLGWTAHGPLRF